MTRLWIPLSMALLGATACHRSEELQTLDGRDEGRAAEPPEVKQAVARIVPTEGNEARGVVHFEQLEGGVRVRAHLTGLKPNGTHGFHVHQYGDCTAKDGESAGEHYSPAGARHGMPGDSGRHAGDMGNVTAGADGVAHFEHVFDVMTVAGKQNPILGRAVIVHEKEDKGTQPSGDAGKRLGCGVIGVANSRQAS